ncbi:MAG: cytochrome c maturation protein CcmE [Thermoleophilia bacterium]|nr:cytochrome c maturation protein CcmE [Thermoleophilia bacterium]
MSDVAPATPEPPKPGFRHVRLAIALVVASLLGTFAVYTAFADSSMPVLSVAQASTGYDGQKIRLEGKVTKTTGDAADPNGMRFILQDNEQTATMPVEYRGAVPDAYRVGRAIVIDGTYENGVFTAVPDTLVTKCPSKYQDKATTSTSSGSS